MESLENLNAAIQQVEDARGVPLSASFVLHRGELAQMIEQTAIVKAAREESKRILAQGREAAEDERAEVEKYIDSRLATLEVILNKTMDAVTRGREKLAGADERDVLSQLADDK